jgi:acyl-ACP thioesterase
MTSPQPAFLAEPATGRVFAARRIVRSTDVTPSGRLRLDALARYLQTAAEDDVAAAGLAEPVVWLVRRCQLTVSALPAMGERVSIRTFCSGTGARWAERTTTVHGAGGPLVQASAVWAAVSRGSGRPVPLSEPFLRIYGGAAGGRTVSARLTRDRPAAGPRNGNASRDWPLRAADFDTAGHVNNAIHWAAIEAVLADGWLPSVAGMEYHRAILPGCTPHLEVDQREHDARVWLLDGERLLASARLAR